MKRLTSEEMSHEVVEIISIATNKIHKCIIDNLTVDEKNCENYNQLKSKLLCAVFLDIASIANYIYLSNCLDKKNFDEIKNLYYIVLFKSLDAIYDEENKALAINFIAELTEQYSSYFTDNDYLDKVTKHFTKTITKTRMDIPYDIDIPDGLSISYAPHLYMIIYHGLSSFLLSLQHVMNEFEIT